MEGHLPLDQVAQSPIQLGLEHFQWRFPHHHEERLVMELKTELSIFPLAAIALSFITSGCRQFKCSVQKALTPRSSHAQSENWLMVRDSHTLQAEGK